MLLDAGSPIKPGVGRGYYGRIGELNGTRMRGLKGREKPKRAFGPVEKQDEDDDEDEQSCPSCASSCPGGPGAQTEGAFAGMHRDQEAVKGEMKFEDRMQT